MNFFSVRFWFFYVIVIIIFQMFFFTIYNIPIYKIYCELNNYYLNDIIINNKYNLKYILYINTQKFNTINYINNYVQLDNFNLLYSNYCITDVINAFYLISNLNFYNIYFNINAYHFFDIFYLNLYNYFFLNFENYQVDNYQNKFNNFFYIIYFNTSITSINLVEFISLQNNIYIVPGETYLIFFRLYNPTNSLIKGISIYFISPNEINAYLFKIQCFCFDELVLYQFESIDLPILFYISSDILFINIEYFIFFQIQIIYLFILNTF
jgi:cytochrome c oxidase assembly protein Cox11